MTTIVWISGATEGVGSGLAKTVPWPETRVINMSRRQHPDYESVLFDLTDPATYPAVEESFRNELDGFTGERAIFVHNAFYPGPGGYGFTSESDQADYARCVQANAAAPLVLGDMFLRHVGTGYESGLVMMSSASARHPFLGMSTYNAAKAGVEMWVRTVKRELAERGRPTWITAVRPGFVLSHSTKLGAQLPPDVFPVGEQIREQLESGEHLLTPEEAGRDIWASLPPRNNESVLLFGTMVESR